MPANEARALLARLGSGQAEHELCSQDGRLALRGAVRSYAASMSAAQREWPPLPPSEGEPSGADSLDVGVLIAFAGGWLDVSDFPEPARSQLPRLQLMRSSDLRTVRTAIPHACVEAAAWHTAATNFATESLRLERSSYRSLDRRIRQEERVERARDAMDRAMEAVAARLEDQRL
ncbi:MAG: hypothetical protein JNM59_07630 [Hyphomonadaceae bacterium]|nr:hypothetical protein [Hyphomonadaceae bacterium]